MSRWAPASDAPIIARGSFQIWQPGLPVGRRRGRGAPREGGAQPVGDGDVDERVERVLAELVGDVADPAARRRPRSRVRTSRRSRGPATWPGGACSSVPAACSARRARRSGSLSTRQLLVRRRVHDRRPALEHVEHEAGVEREAGLHVDRHRQPDHLAAAGGGMVADAASLARHESRLDGRGLDHVPVERPPGGGRHRDHQVGHVVGERPEPGRTLREQLQRGPLELAGTPRRAR